MCDPILVTLLKMRPHYSQPSSENSTPSSGTSTLACYKEEPPPPPPPAYYFRTVEPRYNEPLYNEPLYNEVLGITNDFHYPSNSKIYEKQPRNSEQILPVPWPFFISRFHCNRQ